jgi:general secretion pathway protein E
MKSDRTEIAAVGSAAPMRLSSRDIRDAGDRARAAGRTCLEELEASWTGDRRDLLEQLAALMGLPLATSADLWRTRPRFDLIPIHVATQRHCVAVETDCGLQSVLSDPFDDDLQVWLRARVPAGMPLAMAGRSDLAAYISKQQESVRAVDELEDFAAAAADEDRATEVLSFSSLNEAASPAVKLVSSTLYDALRAGASDVHLEASPSGMTVKYRVDGVLDTAATLTGRELAAQALSRLKVLAELDISERRVPQDGSFRVEADGRDIDLRVSVMPGVHGEDAVIRILDKRNIIETSGKLTLDALGFDSMSVRQLRQLADEPHGMLLVTGPTGSGKTTTLYAALMEVHSGRDKIITIEDPVEYQLPGILQIPVNEKKGLTFARGLRSILRHDPDKIMVGEIRDRETAEIAVQSALTGHLVLTTVHANNVFDVFGRFSHMGVDPYAFVSALNGIWAQRLIRNNCPDCSHEVCADPELVERLGLVADALEGSKFRSGQGCGNCRGTGYKGRSAISEILALDDEIRELVVERAPARQIKAAARRSGTRSLREAALALARQGRTTLEEVKRVTLQS